MEKLKYIPINIWDDFYDDGYVSESKKLETFIYIEDTNISQEKCKEYLEILLTYIKKNLKIDGIKFLIKFYEAKKEYPSLIGTEHERMFFTQWEIRLQGLTHARLDEWIKILENVDIKVDGIPFYIYSES